MGLYSGGLIFGWVYVRVGLYSGGLIIWVCVFSGELIFGLALLQTCVKKLNFRGLVTLYVERYRLILFIQAYLLSFKYLNISAFLETMSPLIELIIPICGIYFLLGCFFF